MNLCAVAASVKAKTADDRDVEIARRLGRASLVLSIVGIVSGITIFSFYLYRPRMFLDNLDFLD